MTITPDPHDAELLAALGRQAAGYALHMMRTTGSVPATVIADTEEGFVFCMPSGLPDEAAKDRFADVARLLAVSHGACAIAMVVEAWARLTKPGGHLDLDTPPSQAPDRQEMVVLMLGRAAPTPSCRSRGICSGNSWSSGSIRHPSSPRRPVASPG